MDGESGCRRQSDSAVLLFPGFPLPTSDYDELRALLQAGDRRGHSQIAVAHSRGALDALASPLLQGVPLVLLAPSVPRRRWATALLRGALLLTAGTPVLRHVLARQLRDRAYHRYGAKAPHGHPLDLRDAALRLRRSARMHVAPGPVVMVVSKQDPRFERQLLLARRLGARVVHQGGGHLFPVTDAAATASTVLAALKKLS